MFAAEIQRLVVHSHPNADRLDIAKVGDYRSIVGKGQFQTGDLAAYIPEGVGGAGRCDSRAWLRGQAGWQQAQPGQGCQAARGALAGAAVPAGRREVARGWVWGLGADVTEQLGVYKYEPPIPTSMSGEVQRLVGGEFKYDIENMKRSPERIPEGISAFPDGMGLAVVHTEKIHGTWCYVGWWPETGWSVTSKGLAAKGLEFKLNEQNDQRNLYVKMFRANQDRFHGVRGWSGYGAGADGSCGGAGGDLRAWRAGLAVWRGSACVPRLRCVRAGVRLCGLGTLWWGRCAGYLRWCPSCRGARSTGSGLPTTYLGASTLADHIREGIVVRTCNEVLVDGERLMQKVISEDYLLRKGGTDYD